MNGAGRRVVVGADDAGRSVVVADEELTALRLAPRGNELAMVWGLDESPRLPRDGGVPVLIPFLPDEGGWRLFFLEIQSTDTELSSKGYDPMPPDLAQAMAQGGGGGMHATDTIDVVIVLGGEGLSIELDDGLEVALGRGDSLVQLGARHAWRKRGPGPATIAVLMSGAKSNHE
jgi:hypothetical protein